MKVTFDGKGINDTNEYASRIAKFQPKYLHLGPEIVRAVNAHEIMLGALKEAVENVEVYTALVELFKYAIAKAEGGK